MKRLILFTVFYPYGSKEEFLETEIKYLSKVFDSIVIIPMYTDNTIREVPSNVSVDERITYNLSKTRLIKEALKSVYFYREVFKNISMLFSIAKIAKLVAFIGRGKVVYYHLKEMYRKEDIYYSYWLNGSVFGCFLYNKNIHTIKFFTRVHSHDLYLERNSGYLPLRPLILEAVTKVFPISLHGYKYLLNHYTVLIDKVKIARLGTSNSGETSCVNQSYNHFFIISCSHVTPVKRLELIFDVILKIARENPDIQIVWTHIGGGVESMKVDNVNNTIPGNLKVEFLGYMANNDVLRYYHEHCVDLFINLSSYEGLPVTFMEAFSCGIPVCAIDLGGISEIVNEDNGILLEQNDSVGDIVSRISFYLRNRDQLHLKRERAYSTWKTSYNADVNYKNFCKELLDD